MTFLIGAFLLTHSLIAQDYKSAIGIRYNSFSSFGGPAISYKQFISEQNAIEANIAFDSPGAIGAVFQKHKNINGTSINWYYGAGGYFVFSKPKAGIGALGNLGLDYKFQAVPVNLSLDWRPELAIAPSVGLDLNTFGFSIRYTIK